MVKFSEFGHLYTSTDGANISWISVTSAIHHFTQPFDSPKIALSSSKSKKSKWYGMTVEAIETQWKATNTYALTLGTWYHKLMEDSVLSHQTMNVDGQELRIIKPIMEGLDKMAPNQKLENNTMYPEHLTYLKSVGIIGQSDMVEVVDGYLNVKDFKTSKEIKTESYTNWEGVRKMMKAPFNHLPDCNLYHYNLQLSLYAYCILKHNPQLKMGKIIINHILFEVESRDKFDNPIYKVDAQGNFIVKGTKDYVVPYLRNESATMMNYLKNNKIPKKAA